MIRWILAFLLFSNLVSAGSHTQLDFIFTESFYNESIYDEYRCASNVFRLIKKAKKSKVDLTQSNVIYILSLGEQGLGDEEKNLSDPDYIYGLFPWPASTRTNAQAGWSFHVVLEEHDKIYDLDFGGAPQIVSKDEYFMRMFYLPDLRYPKLTLFMRVVPALEYLDQYQEDQVDERSNYKDFIAGKVNGRIYPLINLGQLLAD
jgi:hypothetical protein